MSLMPDSNVRCHTCGAAATLVIQETELELGSRVVVVEDEFMQCTDCGSEFYLPGQMDATQKRAVAKARLEEGLLLPEEILTIRQDLGLSQAEFEKLLGVGSKTVVRWEKGTVFQNRATDALLRLIRASRANAELLADMHGVALEPPAAGLKAATGPTYADTLRGHTKSSAARNFWDGQPLVIAVDLHDVTDSDRVGCR
jgi:HTH-type transcriptional regulator / antitoxin MqsA